jgi:large subunit ribosomal protein L21
MYAIVKTGGKQVMAEKDGVVIVEKINGEPGTQIELDEVVMIHDGKTIKVGTPYVTGAKVTAEIVKQGLAKKIDAFTYKAKKNQRKRWGHRQPQTHLRIIEVVGGK